MNELQARLMGRPSIEGPGCPFCGRPSGERHHIVPRSQGGADGPTVAVCGFGNAGGCHGLLHEHRLHLDWDDEAGWWRWLLTPEPTKEQDALEMGGWRPVPRGCGAWR